MLTGARVGEVRQARFEHFNLEHLSWSKPASMTKQRKIHRLPISGPEAAAIVRQRQLLVPRGCASPFPGDVPGQPVKEIRRFWAAIQKAVVFGCPAVLMTCATPLPPCWKRRRLAGDDRQAAGPQPNADHPALCPPDGFAIARGRRRRGERLSAPAQLVHDADEARKSA